MNLSLTSENFPSRLAVVILAQERARVSHFKTSCLENFSLPPRFAPSFLLLAVHGFEGGFEWWRLARSLPYHSHQEIGRPRFPFS